MRFCNDRPFRNLDTFVLAAEFVSAAERLMVHDVRPELLSQSDRARVEYYLKCLSEKFSSEQRPADSSQVALYQ
jgi:hypothetical protein